MHELNHAQFNPEAPHLYIYKQIQKLDKRFAASATTRLLCNPEVYIYIHLRVKWPLVNTNTYRVSPPKRYSQTQNQHQIFLALHNIYTGGQTNINIKHFIYSL